MAPLAIDGMEVGAHALPLEQQRHQAPITAITFYLLDLVDQLFEMQLILVNSAQINIELDKLYDRVTIIFLGQ